jgi:hypothetical protein
MIPPSAGVAAAAGALVIGSVFVSVPRERRGVEWPVLALLTAGTLAGGWWLAQGHAGSAGELFRRAAAACGTESWTG